MSTHFVQLRLTLFLVCCLHISLSSAYNLRRISNENGLSNSAVLSLCQDYENIVWMGTCDGLHLYDGVQAIPTKFLHGCSLSGTVIEDLLEAEKGVIWVLTNYGLDRVDTRLSEITHTFSLMGGRALKKNAANNIFVRGDNNSLYYVCLETQKLQKIDYEEFSQHKLLDIYVDDHDLWVFSEQGIRRFGFNYKDHKAHVTERAEVMDVMPLKQAIVSDSVAYTVDKYGYVCEYNLKTRRKEKLFSVAKEMEVRGDVSDIIAYHDSYFIAFQMDGVIMTEKCGQEYRFKDLGISTGVFGLMRDKMQDVVWIGTDGLGVYVYSEGRYSVRSFSFSDMNIHVNKPIRALFLDKNKDLWLGTKGAGLFKVHNFDITDNELYCQSEQYLASSGKWGEKMVYTFENSSRSLFWIGTDEGVYCYSYNDKRIKSVSCNEPILYIHDLYEEGDSVLWISTVGTGVVKARIMGDENSPHLEIIKRYTIDNGTFSSNFFFALNATDGGRLLFGNRGRGLFTLKNDDLTSIPLKKDYQTPIVRDVLSVKQIDSTIWVGTNYGLIMLRGKLERRFGSSDGFPSNVIHAIEEGHGGNLWMSTNKGILHFDKETFNFQCFNNSNGLQVTEYSDGASLSVPGGLLFGGVDGVTLVREDISYPISDDYLPPIIFLRLNIMGDEVFIGDYVTKEANGNCSLRLLHNENSFTMHFVTPNYIDLKDCDYYYRIGGDSKWINNYDKKNISFIQMVPGDYMVYVKYKNRLTGLESKTYQYHVQILPPWYFCIWMKAVYFLLLVTFIYFWVRRALKRQKRRRKYELERMEREHHDELYEEKLRFFTNITHEFCTPLTLIYGPCEQIMNYEKSDSFVKKYINLIRDNAERLNNLIQEVIEFRRLETGHKVRAVSHFSINELLNKIMPSFVELAERSQVQLSLEIEENLSWNTDNSCFEKIVINLISNAFKYTSVNGAVRVRISAEKESLRLAIYNIGKGIKEEDRKLIFNRYSVLDSIEENRVKKLSTRNGLGLAICYSMVELLEGIIEVESEVGQYAEFIVHLPWLKLTSDKKILNVLPAEIKMEDVLPKVKKEEVEMKDNSHNKSSAKKMIHILAIDDNEDILLLLKESLSEYRLSLARGAEEGLELLKEDMPDLIMTDVMMPGVDGVQLTRQLKGHKHTMHIPLIILSAKNTIDEHVKGISSGADAYISKPFSLTYMRAVINSLITNRGSLKEYYNSSASAFEFVEGKLLAKEDKDSLESILTYINDNIDNADLCAEDLAAHLGISVRALYRRFKAFDQTTPMDLIKDQRMTLAVKLLQTTTLNVQEIIYRSGFNNRSHFYKEFTKKFGCSPKEYRVTNKQKDDSLNA